ncbi:RNA polymerase sigma factor [Umezawaea endophytica]|uniref:Sigma-70 family RNA polymerase sigma factor n=1 Tax=Umezawaea endophytica TaxID=1654476 RepID=A0A9X2VYM8_9PSEU|nr:sigma-70 family RNA polymerase sigma factor [Umezawaea endophytica]MCS7484133.1 sigma-70 family RNA polymerase sigma factor [Umezawaea endophytica]
MSGPGQDDHRRPTRFSAPAPDATLNVAGTTGEWDAQFAVFYREWTKPLVAFLIMQGADVALAADVVQETMAVLYRRWQEVDHPRAWAFRTASQRLVRAVSTVREIPTNELPPLSSPLLRARPTDIERWEQQYDVVDLIARLPPRQRQVMAWSLYGHTPAEIADQLGLSGDAVRANLYRARITLKTWLSRGEGDR